MKRVVIIGGGVGGLSALLWCHRLGVKAQLVEESFRLGGQLHAIHNEVIDYLGLPAGSGAEIFQAFQQHIEQQSLETHLHTKVVKIDSARQLLYTSQSSSPIDFAYAIIATGARNRTLGVPGEADMRTRRQGYSVSRDHHLFKDKPVLVVGGGDRAVEGALLLAEAGAQVTLVHRSQNFRARSEFLHRLFQSSAIRVVRDSQVNKIVYNELGAVKGADIYRKNADECEFIQAAAIFIRIGVAPNSELFTDFLTVDPNGYIEVDSSGRTSHPCFFAIGDVVNHPLYSSIASAAGQGMIAAKTIEYELRTGGGDRK